MNYLLQQINWRYSLLSITGVLITAIALNFLIIQGWSNASPGHDGGHGDDGNIVVANSKYPIVTVQNPVSSDGITETIEAAGTVFSTLQGSIYPRREGLVRQLNVDLGDTVYKGQVLAVLEPNQSQSELTAELTRLNKELEIARKRANLSNDQHLQAAQNTKNAYNKEYTAALEQLGTEEVSITKQLAAELKKLDAEITSATLQKAQSEKAVGSVAADLLDASIELLYEDSATIKNIQRQNTHTRRHEVYGGNNQLFESLEQRILQLYTMLQGSLSKQNTTELLEFLSNFSSDLRLLPATASTNGSSFTASDLDHIREKIGDATDKYFSISKSLVESDAKVISAEAEKERLQIQSEQSIAKLTPQKAVFAASNQEKLADVQTNIVDLQANKSSKLLDAEVIEAEIAKVQSQIGASSTVYAPFAGVITKRHVNIGDSVDSDRPLFNLVDNSKKFVRFYMSESDLPFINKGVEIQFAPTAAPTQNYPAIVQRIAEVIDPITRTILVEADISAVTNNNRILTEMTVHVSIPVNIEANFVAVADSVFDVSNSRSEVFIVNADATVEIKPVTVEYVHGGFAYISEGITKDDWIIIKTPVELTEGMAVDSTL